MIELKKFLVFFVVVVPIFAQDVVDSVKGTEKEVNDQSLSGTDLRDSSLSMEEGEPEEDFQRDSADIEMQDRKDQESGAKSEIEVVFDTLSRSGADESPGHSESTTDSVVQESSQIEVSEDKPSESVFSQKKRSDTINSPEQGKKESDDEKSIIMQRKRSMLRERSRGMVNRNPTSKPKRKRIVDTLSQVDTADTIDAGSTDSDHESLALMYLDSESKGEQKPSLNRKGALIITAASVAVIGGVVTAVLLMNQEEEKKDEDFKIPSPPSVPEACIPNMNSY